MLYLNLGFFWQIPVLGEHGVCVEAHGVNSQSALTTERRDRLPPPGKRLFDPQLYLRDLDLRDCESIIGRLATYPWLNPSVPELANGQTISGWAKAVTGGLEDSWPCALPDAENVHNIVRSCFRFQSEFGVGALIIPAPITRDPESDFSCEARWIDAGLAIASGAYDLPIYATLGISDVCLMHKHPSENELLKIMVDQIAARPELDGVYLVLEQTAPSDSVFLTNSVVAWSILSLCYDLGIKASLRVVVNYLDIFGLACLAAGAEAFGVGPHTKDRRLCLADFVARGGGGAYPKFYAHSLALHLLPRDVGGKIARKRLLRLLESDQTEHSTSFFDALRSNQDFGSVVDWQERVNNTKASYDHFASSIIRETDRLLASQDRISHILAWLQDAERNAHYLAQRFDTDPLTADHRHLSAWRAAFESFIGEYHL